MNLATFLRLCKIGFLFLLLSLMLGYLPATAQEGDQGPTAVESSVAVAGAPVMSQAVLYDSPPPLTEAQALQLERGQAQALVTGPIDTTTQYEVAGPIPGTESTPAGEDLQLNQPDAPGDEMLYTATQFGPAIPTTKGNIMSPTTDGNGVKMFFTGNWFAASSMDKGHTWRYFSPYAGFPSFCCQQVIIHDDARDIYIWLRNGNADANYENVFLLSIAANDPFTKYYWTYTFAPDNIDPSWTNQYWNAPNIQLGADYLYITWNLHGAAGWLRSIVLRMPLDALAIGAGFSYSAYAQADYFTMVPVSGASHVMYVASNWDTSAPYDSLRIWRWDEDSSGLLFWTKTVPAWTGSSIGSSHCGTPNWLNYSDMRLQSGARYEINEEGVDSTPKQVGKKILGWWWNVAEGGGFTNPYVEAAAFYEDSMTLVTGYPGRPFIYGSACFANASFVANARGDLGGVYDYATPDAYQKPKVGYSLADDYNYAPPGWQVNAAASSNAGPSDSMWGYINTARNYQSGNTWIAGAHYIASSSNCANCAVPLWLAFGRERDQANYVNSTQVFGVCIPSALRK